MNGGRKNKSYLNKLEIPPDEWLDWSDEKFNEWRKSNDFPRIIEFLSDWLPYFSIWLSEQNGLSEEDLLSNGPARYIRSYGKSTSYVECDVSVDLFQRGNVRPIVKKYFLCEKEEINNIGKLIRRVDFVSYLDWACLNNGWIFPKKINDFNELASFLVPSGKESESSDYSNSRSCIQLNISMYLQKIDLKDQKSLSKSKTPPRLELLKLGGKNKKIIDGNLGEKNLEFTDIDNLTLESPFIPSFQSFIFSTLHNFKILNENIHSATFHQCTIDIKIENGSLIGCKFEYGDSKLDLTNGALTNSSIKQRRLGVKLNNSDIINSQFKCANISNCSPSDKLTFYKNAKVIFSHLRYPDLAGEFFLLEKRNERMCFLANAFSRKKSLGMTYSVSYLFRFIWMSLQELYWGYGERPMRIVLFSFVCVCLHALFGYFNHNSSTFDELERSFIFSFQCFTNITILPIDQSNKTINLIGAVMSFCGLMSVGLLVASLAAKTKNYN
jgi:hypothetical protein